MAGTVKESLLEQQFNNWKVIEYLGKSKYKCKCLNCKKERDINGYFLKNGQIPKCTCETGKVNSKGLIDLKDKIFGDWKVLEYAGDKFWKCQCLCGCNTIRNVAGSDLRNGKSTGCGRQSNRKLDNLKGQRFGDWLVIEQGPTGKHGETTWLCECQCENKTKRLVNASSLKNGETKSCGHSTTGFKDLTNEIIGNWKVIKRAEDKANRTMWICECQCENHTLKEIDAYSLRNGYTLSCGCLKEQLKKETNLKKYGVNHVAQIGTNRTKEQLRYIENRENFIKAINIVGDKPTATEIGKVIGLDRTSTMLFIHKYELEDLIDFGGKNVSTPEKELRKLFPCSHTSDRTVLDGKEIDLYYPELNLGIEFNGNYWHSDLKKDINYHKNKSIQAIKKNVHLFHIFEYEWNDENTKEKIIKILTNKLDNSSIKTVYARKCIIQEITNTEAKEFLEYNHLQGHSNAKINIALKHENKIVSLMSFDKPRFSLDYQYEVIRLAHSLDVRVIGGTDKMFKYFLNKYNPCSVISYCDFSKFTGEVYLRLGFKLDGITEPNYKWVNFENKILTRYQTQKHRLVELGLGTEDQTEVEIMSNLGFLRIYDCGNYRFIWNKEE